MPAPPTPPRRAPRVEDLALVAAFESGVRGTLLSVMPLVMIRAWGEGTTVSAIYLGVGCLSLLAGLLVPWVARTVPRRRLITAVGGFYVLGATLALTGHPLLTPLALLSNAVATVTFWVCFSATVLDHVDREDLGRNESTRMLYSAPAWTIGPFLGVLLLDLWRPLPFLLAGASAIAIVVAFRRLHLPEPRRGARAMPAGQGPLAYLGRFARRPRLIAGWLFATIRSCGWWVYIVYLPLFCIEQGLGDAVGGAAVSLSNGLLFATPLILRLVQRLGVRTSVRSAFAASALLFVAAWAFSAAPWATVLLLAAASACLIMLDVCGSLPFLMAVKPSERTEMSAVYSTFRDVSGILTPAVSGLVLLALPTAAVFAACGAGMAAAWALAGSLHPRLGRPRLPDAPAPGTMGPDAGEGGEA